ncbi:hypothetical protein AMJ85_04325, partial [candidate division BRC1 bacterium SM23_51]
MQSEKHRVNCSNGFGFSKCGVHPRVAVFAAAVLFFSVMVQPEAIALTGGPDAFGYAFTDST